MTKEMITKTEILEILSILKLGSIYSIYTNLEEGEYPLDDFISSYVKNVNKNGFIRASPLTEECARNEIIAVRNEILSRKG